MSKNTLYGKIKSGNKQSAFKRTQEQDKREADEKKQRDSYIAEQEKRSNEMHKAIAEENKKRMEAKEQQQQPIKTEEPSDDRIKQKLFKSAEGYKDLPNVAKLIAGEAKLLDVPEIQIESVVEEIINRLSKTETGRVGAKLGKGHDPVKSYNKLAALIGSMKY